MKAITDEHKARFFEKVIKTQFCWLWAESKVNRYASFWFDGKSIQAHKFSYLMHHGEIPEDLYVLHRCDVPACVNPSHLFLGTPKDNSQDMLAKGRFVKSIKERQQYGTYFYKDSKTGLGYAVVRIKQSNGKYKRFTRRVDDPNKAAQIAQELRQKHSPR